jgi:hypothetical protein
MAGLLELEPSWQVSEEDSMVILLCCIKDLLYFLGAQMISMNQIMTQKATFYNMKNVNLTYRKQSAWHSTI